MTITLDRPSIPQQVVHHLPKSVPPAHPKRRGRTVRWVTRITLGIGIAIWLLFMLVMAVKVGPAGFSLCFGLAFLPVPIAIAALRWIGRAKPEPRRYWFVAFTSGATAVACVSIVVELILGSVPSWAGAGITEELAKGSIVVLLLLFVRHEFDGIVDGIVYAGFVATGFAFTENVGYIALAFMGKHKSGGTAVQGMGHSHVAQALATFFAREVMLPAGHQLFTVMIGIGLGICAVSAKRAARIIAPIVGFATAIGLHMLWDFAAAQAGTNTAFFLLTFFGFFWPLAIVMACVVILVRKRELRAVEPHLRIYVQHGWIAYWELPALCSFKGRRHARFWAFRAYGKDGERAMTDLQRSVTKLGLLRRKGAAGGVIPDFATREHELLTKLAAARKVLTPAPVAYPVNFAYPHPALVPARAMAWG